MCPRRGPSASPGLREHRPGEKKKRANERGAYLCHYSTKIYTALIDRSDPRVTRSTGCPSASADSRIIGVSDYSSLIACRNGFSTFRGITWGELRAIAKSFRFNFQPIEAFERLRKDTRVSLCLFQFLSFNHSRVARFDLVLSGVFMGSSTLWKKRVYYRL